MSDRAIEELRRLAGRDERLAVEAAGLRALDEAVGGGAWSCRGDPGVLRCVPGRGDEAQVRARPGRRRARAAPRAARRGRAAARPGIRRRESRVGRARRRTRSAITCPTRRHLSSAPKPSRASSRRTPPRSLPRSSSSSCGRGELADRLPEVPAPGEGLTGLVEWAARAHAELFVAAAPARRSARAVDPRGERARFDAARRADLRLDRLAGARPRRAVTGCRRRATCPRAGSPPGTDRRGRRRPG